MTTVTVSSSSKSIDNQIAKFATSAAAVNAMAHAIALAIFRHAAPVEAGEGCLGSGDCTRAAKLVRAMPASFRREMMIAWFKKNTPIRISIKDAGDKAEYAGEYKALKTDEEKLSWWKLANATAETFVDISESNKERGLLDIEDLTKLIQNLSARLARDVEAKKVAPGAIAYAEALSKAVGAIKVNLPANTNTDTVKPAAKAKKAA